MDVKAVILGLAFAMMWSSAFTSARIIVQHAPPLSISALRFLIAGLLAMGIAYIIGQRLRLTRQQIKAIFVFGICQNAIYLGLNFVAMQTVEASLASIIASSMPLVVAAMSLLFLGERLPIVGYAGVALGFSGVVLIMGVRLTGGVDYLGVFYCVIGVVALAIATLVVRTATTGENLLMVVGLQMLVGAAALLGPALLFETWVVNTTPVFFMAFVYTIIVPGIIATFVWFTLVNRIGATKAATFHFLNPFFGVAVAAAILSEKLTIYDILGVTVIMAGILAVQMSRLKP